MEFYVFQHGGVAAVLTGDAEKRFYGAGAYLKKAGGKNTLYNTIKNRC
jgi:hypothetical protein